MRRWLWLPALALVALIVGAGAWYYLSRPALPAVELEGVDPEVVRAVRDARREVERRPNDSAAWGKLGMLLLAHGFRPAALVCLEKAEKLDPKDPRWPLYQAVARPADPAGVECLRRAAERAAGDDPVPRMLLAEALLDQGDPAESEKALGAPVQDGPNRSRWLLILARAKLAQNALDGSETILVTALTGSRSRCPKSAWGLLAEVYQRQGKVKESAEARERTAKLPDDPPWPEPHLDEMFALLVGKQNRLNRLHHLRATGRAEEARELARQIEQDNPEVYWLVEGRIQSGRNDLGAAAAAYRKAVELDPDSREARHELAKTLAAQGKLDDAIVELRLLLKREPRNGAALLLLSRCLRDRDDKPAALEALRQAAAVLPGSAEAQLELGAALLDSGDTAEAIRHLDNALRLKPGDAKAKELLEQAKKKD